MNRKFISLAFLLPALCAMQLFRPITAHATGAFVRVNAYQGLHDGSAAWGDYDNDGYPDLVITSLTNSGPYLAQVWHNNHDNTFSNINVGLGAISRGAVAWADLDNDGYLDLILTGTKQGSPNTAVTEVWQNVGGTNFVKMPNNFQAGALGSIAVGDFDNDGRLDVVINGTVGSATNRVFRNMGNFGFSSAGMPAFDNPGFGFAQFADVDNDGWLDIFAAGTGYNGPFSRMYRNLNGLAVTNIQDLPPTEKARGGFADYNNDGQFDLLITGPFQSAASPGTNAHVWFNNGTGFLESGATFDTGENASCVAAAWGDFDNDGLPDIYLDWSFSSKTPTVYHNNGNNSFANVHAFSINNYGSDFEMPGAWGDLNRDGKLDLLVSETEPTNAALTYSLYVNILSATNAPPTAPSGLTCELATEGTNVTLRWLAAFDAQTPAAGLSYNIRVGTTPGGCDVVSPMADAVTGQRRLLALGNAQLRRFSFLRSLEFGRTYYWSVQAIDSGFAGGAWAPEASFTTRLPIAGDANGDGIISQAELDAVLSHYWATSPWLAMTNPAGLGGTNVQFALPGSNAWNFTVEYSTNLTDWNVLGTATPRYLFNDPSGATGGTRFYRLRFP